ncbi:hypothetical protein BD770DRAFT_383449 [Pilaira anomala]|nr:hypothetical protein BD770DRAFT_383449 [Pilaira anomala]
MQHTSIKNRLASVMDSITALNSFQLSILTSWLFLRFNCIILMAVFFYDFHRFNILGNVFLIVLCFQNYYLCWVY